MWIKKLLKGMKKEITNLVVMYFDSTNVINISKNHVKHVKTNYISIKYYYFRELLQDKEVILEYVKTKEKIDDTFTKELPKGDHEYLRGKLEIIPLDKAI